MSIGKVTEAIGNELGRDFKGLTLKEIKEKILAAFHETYGRYENVTGSMAFEMSHADGQAGMVHWRQIDQEVVTTDEVLSREDAVRRFITKQQMGYQRVFEGTTDEDLVKENTRRLEARSALNAEGLLGTYRNRHKQFIRIHEPVKGVYTIEKGYDGMLSSCDANQSESSVRVELEYARASGYVKDGEEFPDDEKPSSILAEFFGHEPEPVVEEPDTGGFNPNWFK